MNTLTHKHFMTSAAILFASAFLFPLVTLAADAGNDAIDRSLVDSYTNFTIVDTNNPFAVGGEVVEFEYYAKNTNAFRVLIVDGSDEVQWVSAEITPAGAGDDTYTPPAPVAVETGWNLAIYSASSGVIPYDDGGSLAEYEANNAGLPIVGETLTYAGTTDRTYSINATLEVDGDGDGVELGDDLCPNTVADDFDAWGQSKGRYMWDGDAWISSGKGDKKFTPDMEYTYGCSGEQILDSMSESVDADFGGHYKHGLSKSILEAWHAGKYYVGQTFIETVEVASESDTSVFSTTVLDSDKDYFLAAYGTIMAGDGIESDVDYSFRTGSSVVWTDAVSTYEIYGDTLLDLLVDGASQNWGAFDAGNEYQIDYAGTGSTLELVIYDLYYPNNSGSLFVDIIEDKWVDLW